VSRRRLLLAAISSVLVAVALFLAWPWMYAWGAGRFWDRAEPEVHLIPSGYVGPVVILLDDSSAPREREGKARLFRVSPTGLGHSGFGDNVGWGRPDYFYVDAHGHRSRIAAGTPCNHALAGDSVQACLLGHTTFSDLPNRSYTAYVVGRQADQRAWEQKADRFVDSVVYGRRPF
jgi:hypothetical protein